MPHRVIEAGAPKPLGSHFSWAVLTGRTLYSVHVPIRADGSIEIGDARRQTEATLADLEATLKAAGGTLSDVVMVQIFLTSLDHKPVMDEIYGRFFSEPYPVRACVAVVALPTPGTIIELAVTAQIQK